MADRKKIVYSDYWMTCGKCAGTGDEYLTDEFVWGIPITTPCTKCKGSGILPGRQNKRKT